MTLAQKPRTSWMVQVWWIYVFCSQYSSLSHAQHLEPAALPPWLQRKPWALPSTEHKSLEVRIADEEIEELKQKPRVIAGYLGDKPWSFIELVCMTHASWRYINALEGAERFKWDILVFAHPRWAHQSSLICPYLDIHNPDSWGAVYDPHRSQCFTVLYNPPPESVWHGYPFINNVHFFSDPSVGHFMTQHYGYALKTDFDTFISPMWLHFWPRQFTFGVQEYVVVDSTAQRLHKIAGKLRLTHTGQHNLGPAWYGRVQDLITMANLSIPIMHHILTKEFAQKPGGGLKQDWQSGEGFPEWNAGMAALYATELAANHLFSTVASTRSMDEHGDSPLPLAAVHHIHCRHGDGTFSKFEFLKHHYDHVDVTTLDVSTVSGFATFLAVSTWRQLRDAKPERPAAVARHQEL